jgi:hypothetical protein
MDHHEDFAFGHAPPRASNRSFGLLFAGIFAVIALVPLWSNEPPRPWALLAAALMMGLATFRSAWLDLPHRAWMALGVALGNIVGAIAMAFVFFGVITPIGLALRLVGKDPLRRARDPLASSYWLERDPPGPTPESMRNQF